MQSRDVFVGQYLSLYNILTKKSLMLIVLSRKLKFYCVLLFLLSTTAYKRSHINAVHQHSAARQGGKVVIFSQRAVSFKQRRLRVFRICILSQNY